MPSHGEWLALTENLVPTELSARVLLAGQGDDLPKLPSAARSTAVLGAGDKGNGLYMSEKDEKVMAGVGSGKSSINS